MQWLRLLVLGLMCAAAGGCSAFGGMCGTGVAAYSPAAIGPGPGCGCGP